MENNTFTSYNVSDNDTSNNEIEAKDVTVLALQNEYNFEILGDVNNIKGLKWSEVIKNHPETYPRISDLNYNKEALKERIYPFTSTSMEYSLLMDIREEIVKGVNTLVFKEDGLDRGYVNPIKNFLLEAHNIECKDEEILLGKDVITMIQNSIISTTSINDGVIIMPPISNSFRQVISNSKRRIIECPLIYNESSSLYEIDFSKLEGILKDSLNTAFILNNPQNPMGKNYDLEELGQLIELLSKRNVTIISDESYFDFISMDNHQSILTFDIINTIMISTPSKAFNFDSIGGAFAVIKDIEIRNKFKRNLFENSWFNNNTISKIAMEAAYIRGLNYLYALNKHIENNKSYLYNFLDNNMPYIKYTKSEGTYFVWFNFNNLDLPKDDLDNFLKKEALLYLDEGTSFGKEYKGFYRMNIACPWFLLDKHLRLFKKAYEKRLEEKKNPLIKIKRESTRAIKNASKSLKDRFLNLFK